METCKQEVLHRSECQETVMNAKKTRGEFIRWFEEITIDDIALVGGKNASLGEMYRELTPEGILVPNGFAITAEAYHAYLAKTGVDQQ
ncbi:MAG: hypothetical protein KDA78_15175, partial [Planctomycetaceae bacterium]|nr:hypothetical protein [Planctomycetaceae bacterium]